MISGAILLLSGFFLGVLGFSASHRAAPGRSRFLGLSALGMATFALFLVSLVAGLWKEFESAKDTEELKRAAEEYKRDAAESKKYAEDIKKYAIDLKKDAEESKSMLRSTVGEMRIIRSELDDIAARPSVSPLLASSLKKLSNEIGAVAIGLSKTSSFSGEVAARTIPASATPAQVARTPREQAMEATPLLEAKPRPTTADITPVPETGSKTMPAEITRSSLRQRKFARLSFESKNYPLRYLRHQYGKARLSSITKKPLDLKDATFELVPGLANAADEDLRSFRSVNYPGHYLRHRNYALWLDPEGKDILSREDATFRLGPGLSGSDFSSFESVNYPGYYIRHRRSQFFIDKFDGTESFRGDASFKLVEGLWNSTAN